MRRLVATLALIVAVPAPAASAAPRNGPIFYTEDAALKKVSPDGAHAETLADVDFLYDELSFSPSGRRLLGIYGHLALIDPSDGSRIRELPISGELWGRPSWRPSGGEIAFVKCEKSIFTDIDECVQFGIYLSRLNGEHQRRLAQGTDPSWSRNGRTVAFIHQPRERDPSGNPCRGIYVVRPNGRHLRPVFPRKPRCKPHSPLPYNVEISPDGRRVLFQLRGDLWSVRTDGSRAHRIFKPRRGYSVSIARWSPDGSRIAYAIQLSNGKGGVYVTGRSGGRGQRLIRARFAGDLAWQPLPSRR